jgi:outer membrane protein assembly factor BamA
VIGGWRQATQVAFFGLGTNDTSRNDETRYSFTQPYVSATLGVRPTRRWLTLTGGAEYSQWNPGPADSSVPSVEEVFTPDQLPGLLAEPRYLQLFGTVAADWRTSPGYTRRGGYYGVTSNQFIDAGDQYSFRRVDYEAIQHVPLGRDAWVLALRGRVETTYTTGDQVVPFFMMPSLGGGSDLRGFTSWRFRDLNSVLVQAEWRVLVNAFLETALFYDAGKVTSRRADLNLEGLKSDFGAGIRVHGPATTALRIDLARGNEGVHLVFSASAVF